jgi:hypothetical protein
MNNVDPRSPPRLDIPNSHGLWSLWDMLELKAGAFVEAAVMLSGTASFIAGRNLKKSEEAKSPAATVFYEDTALTKDDRSFLRTRLDPLPEHLRALGAEVTLLCVDEADNKIEKSWATWKTVKECFDDITHTLKRELSLKIVIALQPNEAGYFAPKVPLFGQEYANKFKKQGAFELDEAAKCMALSRPTAAVFHLMRILEIGITAISSCLNIPDPVRPTERNWAIILKKIKEDGKKKWPTAADRMAGDGLLFEALHASLDAVKNPWRNETMHVSGKYTDDEAKHIFVAVEGFMKKLSARMDENGKPFA